MRRSSLFAGLLAVAPVLVRANSWVHTNNFTNHLYIAEQAAPDWHFNVGEQCYPSSAFWDGKKTPPGKESFNDNGEIVISGCTDPDEGTNEAHPFPTYYLVRECNYGGGEIEYHVMYNVFFAYSTNIWLGHAYDWEWAVVKWARVPGQNDWWHRKSIILEAHGHKREYAWSDFPATMSENDSNWRKDAEWPVIKFQGDGHGLEAKYELLDKWYRAKSWLSDGAGFPKEDWGKADSPPNTFESGGSHDVCWV